MLKHESLCRRLHEGAANRGGHVAGARVLSNVRSLLKGDDEAVEAAIDRLVGKHILEREGETINANESNHL